MSLVPAHRVCDECGKVLTGEAYTEVAVRTRQAHIFDLCSSCLRNLLDRWGKS